MATDDNEKKAKNQAEEDAQKKADLAAEEEEAQKKADADAAEDAQTKADADAEKEAQKKAKAAAYAAAIESAGKWAAEGKKENKGGDTGIEQQFAATNEKFSENIGIAAEKAKNKAAVRMDKKEENEEKKEDDVAQNTGEPEMADKPANFGADFTPLDSTNTGPNMIAPAPNIDTVALEALKKDKAPEQTQGLDEVGQTTPKPGG